MRKKIILKRKINVECWHIQGMFAFAKKRLDIIPLLQQCQTNGYINDTEAARELLLEETARKKVAARWLENAHYLGLLEWQDRNKSFILTPQGERALSEKEVFVPQDGDWMVWCSKDPVLPYPILGIKAIEQKEIKSTHDEINREKKQEKNGNGLSLENLYEDVPEYLRQTQESHEPHRLCAEGTRICCDEIKKNGSPEQDDSSLSLIWDIANRSVQLQGFLAGKSINSNVEGPEIDENECWESLLEGKKLLQTWDPTKETLGVAFDERLTPEERTRFERLLQFSPVRINNFGSFEDWETPVTLTAIGQQSAQDWAEWVLQNSVDDFATEKNFTSWIQKASEHFHNFAIQLPDRAQFIENSAASRMASPRDWFTASMKDWNI